MCAVEDIRNTVKALSYATGDEWTVEKAMHIGKRMMNMMRLYNLKSGITVELEEPSQRYSSSPVDGPNAGREIKNNFFTMRKRYFELMGWDERGVPTEDTLKKYDLEALIPDLALVPDKPYAPHAA
jgi:aldehyde:ferredoxin oxidoreductase